MRTSLGPCLHSRSRLLHGSKPTAPHRSCSATIRRPCKPSTNAQHHTCLLRTSRRKPPLQPVSAAAVPDTPGDDADAGEPEPSVAAAASAAVDAFNNDQAAAATEEEGGEQEYEEELEADWEEEDEEGEVGEGEEEENEVNAYLKYPEPPIRAQPLSSLCAEADMLEAAHDLMLLGEVNPVINGLQNNYARVDPGDVFFCPPGDRPFMDEELVPPDMAMEAVGRGALVVVTEEEAVADEVGSRAEVLLVDDVEEAQARMAAAFYEHPSKRMDVVAVTGSAGKTTVAWLVRGMLEEAGRRVGMVGSLEWALDELYLDVDGDWWFTEDKDTTAGRDCSVPFHISEYKGRYQPPADINSLSVQRALAGIADRGGDTAVLEVAPLSVGRATTSFVHPRVAVYTNLADKDPLGILRSAEEHVACAAMLFEGLREEAGQRAVVNADDPHHQAIVDSCEVPVVTFSLQPMGGDVWLESYSPTQWEAELVITTPRGRLQIITPLLGRHNAANVLAAVATGEAMGLPLEVIVRGLEAVEVVPGRSEIIDEGQPFPVVVDAAATPESLAAMLDAVREGRPPGGRVFLVIGCPGEGSRALRPYIGEVAHLKAEYVLLTNDSPGEEDPHAIIQDIVAGFPEDVLNIGAGYPYWFLQDQGRCPLWFEPYLQSMQRKCHRYVMEDRWSAIRAAIGTAGQGDVVLIAGRGAQEVVEHGSAGGGIIPGWFDDRVEARNAISRLPSLGQLRKLSRKDLPWGETLDKEFDTVYI